MYLMNSVSWIQYKNILNVQTLLFPKIENKKKKASYFIKEHFSHKNHNLQTNCSRFSKMLSKTSKTDQLIHLDILYLDYYLK